MSLTIGLRNDYYISKDCVNVNFYMLNYGFYIRKRKCVVDLHFRYATEYWSTYSRESIMLQELLMIFRDKVEIKLTKQGS